nr:MAG TPA_asm: hypothetical protein [Caudoviricetes sp.]
MTKLSTSCLRRSSMEPLCSIRSALFFFTEK